MAVSASDLVLRYSKVTATAGWQTGGTASTSRGKFMAQEAMPSGALHNLFDVVSADENAAADVEYRCVFIHNTNATDSALNGKLWVSQIDGGAGAAIAHDLAGAVAYNLGTAQADDIVDESTAPSPALSWSTVSSRSTGLTVPTLAANQCIGVWIKRTAANSDAMSNDGASLYLYVETA